MRNKAILTGLISVLSIATLATGCGKKTEIPKKSEVIEGKMERTSESASETTVETTTSDTETETTTSATVTEGTTTGKGSTKPTTTQVPTETPKPTTEIPIPTTEEPQPTTPAHTHSYSAADCTHAATCSCGATNGSALGHDYGNNNQTCSRCGNPNPNYQAPHTHSYSPADCTHAATCSCGATNGSALGHDYGNNNKTCSRCGNPNPNYQAPGTEVGTTVEIGTYSTSDLVANGICPNGYASGTTVRFYRVYDGSVWQKYVQVNFSGSTIPSDFSPSGNIQGSAATSSIVACLKRGVSGTLNYGWESYGM